jgi:flagellar biosynthesis protein FlhF
MKIKRFTANSLPEAMKEAKEQMGNEAIIIYSRKYKEGGLLGLFARQKFEITVAADENYQSNFPSSSLIETLSDSNSMKATEDLDPSKYESGSNGSSNEILEEVRSMKEMVENLQERIDDSQSKAQSHNGRLLFKLLIARQVEQKLANRIVKTVEDRMERENARDFSRVKELSVQVVAELGFKIIWHKPCCNAF